MKKLKVILAVMLSLLLILPLGVQAQEEISVYVNGYEPAFDVAPVIINDRTMVPMRAIFQSVGAEILWDGDTQTVTALKGENTIEMQIGRDYMLKNGEQIALDSVPVIIDNRTLVPVRAASEALDANVQWSEKNNTVVIMTNGVSVYSDFPVVPDYGFYMNEECVDIKESGSGVTRLSYLHTNDEGDIYKYIDALEQMDYFISDTFSDEYGLEHTFAFSNKSLNTALYLTFYIPEALVCLDIQPINQ